MRVRPRSRMQMHSGNDLHRWTVSFADFMTLMFAVFVVLYAVSANDKAQYKEVIQSIQNSAKVLNNALLSSSNDGVLTHSSNVIIEDIGPALLSNIKYQQSNEAVAAVIEQQAGDQLSEQVKGEILKTGHELNQIKLDLETLFASELNKEGVDLDLNGDWLTIEMGGDILFAGGSHTLLNSANAMVSKLSLALKPVNNLLRIRGYSDSESVANELYRSNWELSGMRAFSVLHALNKQGISGERMVVEAYGRFSPVLDQNNRVNPIKSRRVVIAISKYALVTAPITRDLSQDKSAQTSTPVRSPLPKQDSKEMREVYLPNNRLIITTRQE